MIVAGFIPLVNCIVTTRQTVVLATSGAVVSFRVKVIGFDGTSALPSLARDRPR